MPKRLTVFGSRGSELARVQARNILARFERFFPELDCELRTISTTGDRETGISLSSMPVQGVFVREIEQALRSGEIDVAVHSLKDLPTRQPESLLIAAIPERADVRDALYTGKVPDLGILSRGSVIGTSSVRRAAQMCYLNGHAQIKEIRGNVDTRMRKVDDGQYDATILAAAGLERLGRLQEAAYIFDPNEFLPAPGQGALALEVRADDHELITRLERLDSLEARTAVTAERAVLEALGSGCSLPLGVHANVDDSTVSLTAAVFDPDGKKRIRVSGTANVLKASELGKRLADELVEGGAESLLRAPGDRVDGQ